MFVTADQILCHLVGDYILQSSWMASKKTSQSFPALVHAVFYSMPFAVMLFLLRVPMSKSWIPLLVISGTHFIIDRFRLARYLCWGKDFIAPKILKVNTSIKVPNVIVGRTETSKVLEWREEGKTYLGRNYLWSMCSKTGYPDTNPVWLSTWLLIIADNTVHIAINALAIWGLT